MVGFTEAMKVSAGTITSSPGFTPAVSAARCRAAEPEAQHTAWGMPTYFAMHSSISPTLAPLVDTHAPSSASSTYLRSLPQKLGTERGMNSLML